jgi:hypothetical protein
MKEYLVFKRPVKRTLLTKVDVHKSPPMAQNQSLSEKIQGPSKTSPSKSKDAIGDEQTARDAS